MRFESFESALKGRKNIDGGGAVGLRLRHEKDADAANASHNTVNMLTLFSTFTENKKEKEKNEEKKQKKKEELKEKTKETHKRVRARGNTLKIFGSHTRRTARARSTKGNAATLAETQKEFKRRLRGLRG